MGRGTRNTAQATSGAALRAALGVGTPDWLLDDEDGTPAEEIAVAPIEPAPVVPSRASSNSAALRALLTGAADEMDELLERGPEGGRTKEDRKNSRAKFSKDLLELATRTSQELAKTDEGRRAELRVYAQFPEYSPNNLHLAASQLRSKNRLAVVAGEFDEYAPKFSRTGWQALGRTVKPGLEEPRGEARGSEWDASKSANMYAPASGFTKQLDEIDPETGKKKTQFIPNSYSAFLVYHVDATEGDPLPSTPWSNATGSNEDAEKLMGDLDRITQYRGLKVRDVALGSNVASRNDPKQGLGQPVATGHLDAVKNEIVLDSMSSAPERAFATLRALSQHVGRQVEPKRLAKIELSAADLDRAAAESTAFVISSLYGLESDEQTFHELSSFAGSRERMSMLNSEVHHRVGALLDYLDPVRAKKAEAAKEATAKRIADRKAKAAEQGSDGTATRSRAARAKKRGTSSGASARRTAPKAA